MRRSVLPAVLLLAACSANDDPQKVRAIVDKANADAARWYASADTQSLGSLFTEDAWQMPPNSPPLVGREAILKFWQQATSWGKWDFTLQAQDVSVSGPMAVERGRYVLKFTPGVDAPKNMASFEDHGNYLVQWRKGADGVWRIAADAPVSEAPQAPPGQSQ
ncbi:MAG TPA: DUF4440 domain-containing protein [Steroidobacteraceae bacterium]|nr:DUF4440 domain-containing protein [Steroidobacteraceae bacterium]